MEWNLQTLFSSLDAKLESELSVARASLAHPGTKGDASENVWMDWLRTYLPSRYQVTKGHVMDSHGGASQQIDIIIFDRQYSPPLFQHAEQKVVPAESVYAVFEVKQEMTPEYVRAAQEKIASVRRLHRNNLPAPQLGSDGPVQPKRPPFHIPGGLLALGGGWTDGVQNELLIGSAEDSRLNLGCSAAEGWFQLQDGTYAFHPKPKAATAFLFELIMVLQDLGTVPVIDMRAYARKMK